MNNINLISLKLNIAGKMYPVKIAENEVSIARVIEKEINQKLTDYSIEYEGIDEKDALIMLLLTYAFENQKQNNSNDTLVDNKLKVLEKLVGNLT